jgi:hypothetical protein
MIVAVAVIMAVAVTMIVMIMVVIMVMGVVAAIHHALTVRAAGAGKSLRRFGTSDAPFAGIAY